MESLCRVANDQDIACVQHPGRHIELTLPRGEARVVPVVGHPRSEHYQQASHEHQPGPERTVVLLHDTLGALPRRREHLLWFDEHFPVQSLDGSEAVTWLNRK